MSYLHGGSVRVTVQRDDFDAVPLQLDGDLLAQFAGAAKEAFFPSGDNVVPILTIVTYCLGQTKLAINDIIRLFSADKYPGGRFYPEK